MVIQKHVDLSVQLNDWIEKAKLDDIQAGKLVGASTSAMKDWRSGARGLKPKKARELEELLSDAASAQSKLKQLDEMAERVRTLRYQKGWSKRDDLADHAGIPYSIVSDAENGIRIAPEELSKIAGALGVTMAALTGEKTDVVSLPVNQARETPALTPTIADVMAQTRQQIAKIAGVKLEAVKLELKIEN